MKPWIPVVLSALGLFACDRADVHSLAMPPQATEPTESIPSDAVTAWNREILDVAEAEDRFLTLKGLRTAAMVHLAMHDVLNAIEPRYEPYLPVPGRAEGDPLAAMTQAAFRVATDQYPKADGLLRERDRWLSTIEDGPPKTRGMETGDRVAQRILAERRGDGWNRDAAYQWHPMGPGVYAEFSEHSGTPSGFVFGAGWAEARPFVLEAPDHFSSPPPPDISSEAYVAAFREVKSIGRYESSMRTDDQTHLALWWKEFVESSHNRLARELALEEDLDAWESARLFARLQMSIYDAYVNVFHNKFHYNHWRPYTAIRWAAEDGNPETAPDLQWTNTHQHTYAFPSYPSAHGTACAAAMTLLEDTFGAERPFTMTIPEVDVAGPLGDRMAMDPATRSFENFAAAAWECSLSRVYLGIHFRYDSTEGNALGTKIGRYVVDNSLAPIERPPSF